MSACMYTNLSFNRFWIVVCIMLMYVCICMYKCVCIWYPFSDQMGGKPSIYVNMFWIAIMHSSAIDSMRLRVCMYMHV